MKNNIIKKGDCYRKKLGFVNIQKGLDPNLIVNKPIEMDETIDICPNKDELNQVIAICQDSIIAQYKEWLRNSV